MSESPPFYPRRETPRVPTDGLCGQEPLGARLSTDAPELLRCLEPKWHLDRCQHRNARGDVWGMVVRPIDAVPERVLHLW